MRNFKTTDTRKSYMKAVLLLALLIIVFIISDRLYSGKVPKLDLANLQTGLAKNKNTVLYDDSRRDAVRKNIAGFWMTALSDTLITPAVRVDDRVELKDNGIIWQVKQYRVKLPAGDTIRYTYIMTGYLMPHGQQLAADSTAFSDIRVLYQVMINGPDTCYGASDVTTGWSHASKPSADSILTIDGRRFTAYSGVLTEFFPKGAIDLVKKISMNPCPPDLSFFNVLQKRVSADYLSKKESVRDTTLVRQALANYYSLLLQQAISSQYSIGDIGKTPEVTVHFTVKADGSFFDVKVDKPTLGVNAIERFTAATISGLKVSPAPGAKDVKMSYTHKQI